MAHSCERLRPPLKECREVFNSPRKVLRHLIILCEGRQYREAANFINRLGPSILQYVLAELPMDILLEALPLSGHLLESIFFRLKILGLKPQPRISLDLVVWHLVGFFSAPHEPALRKKYTNLIQTVVEWQPELRHKVKERQKVIDHAVHSLGMHGLATNDFGTLVSLHAALKEEIQFHIDTFKSAIQKLDDLSNVILNSHPAKSSHQRLLAFSYEGVQQRLIDNTCLLSILDKPSLDQLQQLVNRLAERVQGDKLVLESVRQIRSLVAVPANLNKVPIATLLMSFSRGCDIVVKLMGPNFSVKSANDGFYSKSIQLRSSFGLECSRLPPIVQ